MPPEVSNLANRPGSSSSLAREIDALLNRPDVMVPTEGIPPLPSSTRTTLSGEPGDVGDAGDRSLSRPIVHDGLADEEKSGDVNRWWEWVTGKIEAIKGWAAGTYGADAVPTNNSTDDTQN